MNHTGPHHEETYTFIPCRFQQCIHSHSGSLEYKITQILIDGSESGMKRYSWCKPPTNVGFGVINGRWQLILHLLNSISFLAIETSVIWVSYKGWLNVASFQSQFIFFFSLAMKFRKKKLCIVSTIKGDNQPSLRFYCRKKIKLHRGRVEGNI